MLSTDDDARRSALTCPRCGRRVPRVGSGQTVPAEHRGANGGLCVVAGHTKPNWRIAAPPLHPGGGSDHRNVPIFAHCPVCGLKLSISPRRQIIPKHRTKGAESECVGRGMVPGQTWAGQATSQQKKAQKAKEAEAARPSVLPRRTISAEQISFASKRAQASAQKRGKYTGRGSDGWPLSTSVRAVPTSPPGTGKRS